MTPAMQRVLSGIAGVVVVADFVWISAVRASVDFPGYLLISTVTICLCALAVFYRRFRRDDNLSAMLSGTAFLVVFSAAFSALNYLLLTLAGHRIDAPLAHIDQQFGFYWPALMALIAKHPAWNLVLGWSYSSLLPQIIVVLLALGWTGRSVEIFRLCIAVAVGAFICVSFWTIFPSFGAFSYYQLSPKIASHLAVTLDGHYANALIDLLNNGPGKISPREARGLIGFPSFHAALAVMTCWYASQIPVLKWSLLGLNACLLFATPIQGGHHLVDVIAGVLVGVLSIAAAKKISTALQDSSQPTVSDAPVLLPGSRALG